MQQTSSDSGSVTIPVETCDVVEETKQYCGNLPTEVLCSNTTVRLLRITLLLNYIFQFPTILNSQLNK